MLSSIDSMRQGRVCFQGLVCTFHIPMHIVLTRVGSLFIVYKYYTGLKYFYIPGAPSCMLTPDYNAQFTTS